MILRLRPLTSSLVALSLVASSLSIGCQEAAPGESEDVAETADQELTVAELTAAIAALDDAIGELRSHIATLKLEIADLDADNAAKLREIDNLVRSIEQRKREVQDQYERDRRNALMFCFLGYCNVGLVSLSNAFDNDARLRQLENELAAAKREQAKASDDAASWRAHKTALDVRLAQLEGTEQKLLALLAQRDTGSTQLVRLAKRADRMTALHENLESQANVLVAVKGLAKNLATVIDTALVKVAVAEAKADKLAQASRKATYDLLRILTSGDPDAAAQKWLENAVAKRTKAMLKEIGWDPEGFVDQLVARAFPGSEQSPAAKLLRDQLRAAIRSA
jgi:chromosome segregation ATPase